MFDVWHLGIPVRSLEASLQFYVNGLGFEFLGYYEQTMGFVRPPGGAFTLEFIEYPPTENAESHRQPDHVAFECEDVAAYRQKLLTAGQIQEVGQLKDSNNGMRVFSVRDPDGIVIQFYQGKANFEKAIQPTVTSLPRRA